MGVGRSRNPPFGAIGALILAYDANQPLVAIVDIIAIGVTLGAEVDVVAYIIAGYCEWSDIRVSTASPR